MIDQPSVGRTYIDMYVEDEVHPRQTAVQRMSLLLLNTIKKSFDHGSLRSFVASAIHVGPSPKTIHLKSVPPPP